ncbi:hypothetical protein AVEN_76679-1, partial [Araneus ventricosus]
MDLFDEKIWGYRIPKKRRNENLHLLDRCHSLGVYVNVLNRVQPIKLDKKNLTRGRDRLHYPGVRDRHSTRGRDRHLTPGGRDRHPSRAGTDTIPGQGQHTSSRGRAPSRTDTHQGGTDTHSRGRDRTPLPEAWDRPHSGAWDRHHHSGRGRTDTLTSGQGQTPTRGSGTVTACTPGAGTDTHSAGQGQTPTPEDRHLYLGAVDRPHPGAGIDTHPATAHLGQGQTHPGRNRPHPGQGQTLHPGQDNTPTRGRTLGQTLTRQDTPRGRDRPHPGRGAAHSPGAGTEPSLRAEADTSSGADRTTHSSGQDRALT